ncbi:hypothetical protein J6590_002537 [Homalodisca vitripennis]|nr:hypothetical protein J6590_002537 [Homalodisca vitripennis]
MTFVDMLTVFLKYRDTEEKCVKSDKHLIDIFLEILTFFGTRFWAGHLLVNRLFPGHGITLAELERNDTSLHPHRAPTITAHERQDTAMLLLCGYSNRQRFSLFSSCWLTREMVGVSISLPSRPSYVGAAAIFVITAFRQYKECVCGFVYQHVLPNTRLFVVTAKTQHDDCAVFSHYLLSFVSVILSIQSQHSEDGRNQFALGGGGSLI